MNVSRARLHLGIAAAGTLAAAALVPGIASADPADTDSARLVNSTCSFAQIDAAMHDVTPQLAARLDQHPSARLNWRTSSRSPLPIVRPSSIRTRS